MISNQLLNFFKTNKLLTIVMKNRKLILILSFFIASVVSDQTIGLPTRPETDATMISNSPTVNYSLIKGETKLRLQQGNETRRKKTGIKEKIILDTDIGSDIDDAICLAYLLAKPECELLGITTVSGEADNRAMIASMICKAAGKHIPIFPGAEEPLIIPQKQPIARQAKVLSAWEHEKKFPHGEAIEFMRQTIRKYPGEITLIAIGPLTNIALLFKIDPEIPHLLKSLVMMGGVFINLNPYPTEWNIRCDPHAAAIVYRSHANIHKSIGLDVTLKVTMAVSEVQDRFKSSSLLPVLDIIKALYKPTDIITFHDPLAVTTIFNKEICSFKKGKVEVEIAGERGEGFTAWEQCETGGFHEVAAEVNSQNFFTEYFSVF